MLRLAPCRTAWKVEAEKTMSLFPIFVKLQGRPVVVVGGGNIAAGKIPGLLQAQARVKVIAPQVNSQVSAWVHNAGIEWSVRRFFGYRRHFDSSRERRCLSGRASPRHFLQLR
jgi:hypothetical protein